MDREHVAARRGATGAGAGSQTTSTPPSRPASVGRRATAAAPNSARPPRRWRTSVTRGCTAATGARPGTKASHSSSPRPSASAASSPRVKRATPRPASRARASTPTFIVTGRYRLARLCRRDHGSPWCTTSSWTCAGPSASSSPCATSSRRPTSSRRSTTRRGPRAASRTARCTRPSCSACARAPAPSAPCCRCTRPRWSRSTCAATTS